MPIDAFFLRALAGGLGVAAVAGPLGCFVVWRRMAYFGDTMAHSALLGVALGFALAVDLLVGVLLVTILVALAMVALQRGRTWLSADSLLGILSHAALSFGLIGVALLVSQRLDLLSFLFGDILAVTAADLWVVWIGAAVVLAVLAAIWRPLLAATVHPDLARAEGVPVDAVGVVFTLLIAAVIALAMKIVGILLITSMLILPAATARRFAATPEVMALLSVVLGALAVVAGLAASLQFDVPSGPAIVAAAAVLFALALLPLPLSRAGRRR